MKSNKIIYKFKDAKFKDYPTIFSKYIRLLRYNSLFKLVENLEKRMEYSKAKLKNFCSDKNYDPKY